MSETQEILEDPENFKILVQIVFSFILLFAAHIVPFVTNIISIVQTNEQSVEGEDQPLVRNTATTVTLMVFAVIRVLFTLLILRKNEYSAPILALFSIAAQATILGNVPLKQPGYIIDLISVVLSFLMLNQSRVENLLRNNVVILFVYLLAFGINIASIIGTAVSQPDPPEFQPLYVPLGLIITTLLLGVLRGYQGFLLNQNIIVIIILTLISIVSNIFVLLDFPIKIPFYITDAVVVFINFLLTSATIREP